MGESIRYTEGSEQPLKKKKVLDSQFKHDKSLPSQTGSTDVHHPVMDMDEIMVRKIRDIAAKSQSRASASKSNLPTDFDFPSDHKQNPIRWPSDKEITDVARRLLAIKKAGLTYEKRGDHFNSGDLAYQMQELLRNVSELFQKSRRIHKKPA